VGAPRRHRRGSAFASPGRGVTSPLRPLTARHTLDVLSTRPQPLSPERTCFREVASKRTPVAFSAPCPPPRSGGCPTSSSTRPKPAIDSPTHLPSPAARTGATACTAPARTRATACTAPARTTKSAFTSADGVSRRASSMASTTSAMAQAARRVSVGGGRTEAAAQPVARPQDHELDANRRGVELLGRRVNSYSRGSRDRSVLPRIRHDTPAHGDTPPPRRAVARRRSVR